MTYVAHDQAFDALVNPDIPLEKAIKLFERAYRRSNDATKSSVIEAALGLRLKVRKERGMIMTASEIREREALCSCEMQRISAPFQKLFEEGIVRPMTGELWAALVRKGDLSEDGRKILDAAYNASCRQ